VDKVTKDKSGSGLLKEPELLCEILAEIVAAVKVPVTIKIRIGWDDSSIVAPKIVAMAEQAGAVAISVHGRTRAQGYRGEADRDVIRQCKEAAKHIKVIGNGDIFTPESAVDMFDRTGCDGVLVSRGTFGAPWICDDIYRVMEGNPSQERDPVEELRRHFEAIVDYHPERRALLHMRRVGCWYIKGRSGAKEFRGAICKAKSVDEVRDLIDALDLTESSMSAITGT
jgi:tRNA-dihydrouridine synthase B